MPKTKMLAKEESNEKIRCLACSHQCLISEGKTGICGVRKNIKGKLSLLVYGRLCAVHVDPIEKKPLYHFMPGTKTFSVGTVGCNFHCTFCQNWAISQSSEKGEFFGYNYEPKDVINSALKNNCQSISYTYNEPTIFIEFVKDCATLAKKKGLKNVMVTNGFMSEECFEYIKSEIDAMNIDLKGNDEFYKKICGARLKPVLDTIKRADKARIHVELTTLIIPGENDSDKDFEKIAKFIASVNKNIAWHISRFFPMYKMLDKPITPIETLERAYKIGKKYLKNVHMGNI